MTWHNATLKVSFSKSGSEICFKAVFKEATMSMHYGSFLFVRSKLAQDLADQSRADSDLQLAKRIYEEHLGSGGDFAVIRLATVIKEIGMLN